TSYWPASRCGSAKPARRGLVGELDQKVLDPRRVGRVGLERQVALKGCSRPCGLLLLVVEKPQLTEGIGEARIEPGRALVTLPRLTGLVGPVRDIAGSLRLQPVEVAVVELGDCIVRSDREHAVELLPGEREATD